MLSPDFYGQSSETHVRFLDWMPVYSERERSLSLAMSAGSLTSLTRPLLRSVQVEFAELYFCLRGLKWSTTPAQIYVEINQKWTDLQCTVIWFSILMDMLCLAGSSQDLCQKITVHSLNKAVQTDKRKNNKPKQDRLSRIWCRAGYSPNQIINQWHQHVFKERTRWVRPEQTFRLALVLTVLTTASYGVTRSASYFHFGKEEGKKQTNNVDSNISIRPQKLYSTDDEVLRHAQIMPDRKKIQSFQFFFFSRWA